MFGLCRDVCKFFFHLVISSGPGSLFPSQGFLLHRVNYTSLTWLLLVKKKEREKEKERESCQTV